jgi:hypothetical protein
VGLIKEPELAGGIEISITDGIFSQREIEIINLIAEGN